MQYYFPNYPDISIDKTIAIDLGTTNTTAVVVRHDKVEAIELDGNLRLLRSVVSYRKSGTVVGQAAINCANTSLLTVENIKRIAGLSYQEAMKFERTYFGCNIEHQGDMVLLRRSDDEDNNYTKTVEEVIADIFSNIKEVVENKFSTEYKYLVITVPSTYTSSQKGAIRKAAEQAGFCVVSMLMEPTAAGIHYHNIGLINRKSVFLIFDFGGGTLDLSLVQHDHNKFAVLSTGGNPRLGGNDIDSALLGCVKRLYSENHQTQLVLRGRRLRDLMKAIEKAKIELQISPTSVIEADNNPYEITLSQFNDSISHIITEAMNCVVELGNDMRDRYENKRINGYLITRDDSSKDIILGIVDRVLLVGGSSKLVIVKEKLNEFFGKEITYIDTDSQLCVGSGAMESMLYIARNNQIHECLYNSYSFCVNGIEKGHVQRGTTIPFSVSFVLGRMRGNFQMELVVKEFQPGRDERIVLENNYQYALTRSTILILSVEIQYDGLLAIRLIDENLNVIEMLGNFEYSPVCYKHGKRKIRLYQSEAYHRKISSENRRFPPPRR